MASSLRWSWKPPDFSSKKAPSIPKRKAYSSRVKAEAGSSLATIKAVIWVLKGTSQSQVNWSNGGCEEGDVLEEAGLSNWWSEFPYRDHRLGWQMNERLAHQSETKVPLLAVQVVQQSLVDKATISQQRDHAAVRQDGTGLLQYWLIILHSPPSYSGAASLAKPAAGHDPGR